MSEWHSGLTDLGGRTPYPSEIGEVFTLHFPMYNPLINVLTSPPLIVLRKNWDDSVLL